MQIVLPALVALAPLLAPAAADFREASFGNADCSGAANFGPKVIADHWFRNGDLLR